MCLYLVGVQKAERVGHLFILVCFHRFNALFLLYLSVSLTTENRKVGFMSVEFLTDILEGT